MNDKLQIVKTLGYILLLVASIIACESNLTQESFYGEEENVSITEYMMARPDSFSKFLEVVKAADLEGTMEAYNPHGSGYTLFLPTNKAFDKFISENDRYSDFNELLKDTGYVRELGRYHLVNMSMRTNDFPYGSLPDTTVSGDVLTMGFSEALDTTIYKVNNEAPVIKGDIEVINGYVHIISRVLSPVIFTSYESLSQRESFSIMTRAFEETGLSDTFNIQNGTNKYPSNTVLAEPDSVFYKSGISSFQDLTEKVSPNSQNYTSFSNGLYQFVAYHIIDGNYFLNDFEGQNTNFNTYGSLPIYVNATGIDITINKGVTNFDTLITNGDTSVIDYVGIHYDVSNVLTNNGPVHVLDQVMYLYEPSRTDRSFQFLEEPIINEADNNPQTYEFDEEDKEEFSVINWSGVDEITYFKSSTPITGAWNNNYLILDGNFSVTYEIPKLLPGEYVLNVRADGSSQDNAIIQVYLDGNQIGGNIDLTSGAPSWGPFNTYQVGFVNFSNYEKHTLRITSLVPGRFTWDAVQFQVKRD